LEGSTLKKCDIFFEILDEDGMTGDEEIRGDPRREGEEHGEIDLLTDERYHERRDVHQELEPDEEREQPAYRGRIVSWCLFDQHGECSEITTVK
jgi:hypothetical protein